MLQDAQEIPGLADPLVRHVDFDSIEDVTHVEELYSTLASGYILSVNDVAYTLTEEDAFDWLRLHGCEDIHLDIMLDRISDVKSAYE
ncbi:hypothetical protein QLQ09_24165 [Brucella sp. NM4]|uniref:hypothetical protein n=1 Tax=Brucella sp. NM4 TaxID=3045175 RepID=UPI0024BC74D3|nr:hypothetical protein [Brucella sp. NM4]WHS33924.1 hypothetical protein QLQ09_24165 [Brucella sp. NM4]